MSKWWIAALLSLALFACSKKEPPYDAPASSAPPATQPAIKARGELSITIRGTTAVFPVDAGVAFDMPNGSGINLDVACPTARSGCGLIPQAPLSPLDQLARCPGGRLVQLHFSSPLSALRPGKYTSEGKTHAMVSMLWSEGVPGQTEMTADNWTDSVGELTAVSGEQISGVIDGQYMDGSVAIKGSFTVPVCRR
jgi:hypothetical protein